MNKINLWTALGLVIIAVGIATTLYLSTYYLFALGLYDVVTVIKTQTRNFNQFGLGIVRILTAIVFSFGGILISLILGTEIMKK